MKLISCTKLLVLFVIIPFDFFCIKTTISEWFGFLLGVKEFVSISWVKP